MKNSTRICYGTRALLELARTYDQGTLTSMAISKAQNLSAKYLEQIIQKLKASGFVIAVRGAKGGYTLAKPPSMIRMSDVYGCLEGQEPIVDCIQQGTACTRISFCKTRPVWIEVEKAIMNVLESVTLQDLLDKAM